MTEDLALLREAALTAGEIALARRAAGLNVWSKAEGSPVTDADLAVDAHLREALGAARPDYGWLSEETPDSPERLERRTVFVVDPIDGTTAFMRRRPWWTVALAVVTDGVPAAAVVHAPQLGETFEAALGGGARLNGEPIRASEADRLEDAAILADAALIDRPIWTEPWPAMRLEKRNSIAYRLALVGAGAFDAALALSPKWDWDLAAGALIATEAGAFAGDHRGRAWRFNGPLARQPSLVAAAPALTPLILRRCATISLPGD